MVFKNDSGYNLNSISNNDNYIVLSLNLSRSEQKLFSEKISEKKNNGTKWHTG